MKTLILTIAALVGAIAFADEIKIGIVGIDTSHAIEFTKHINVEKDRRPGSVAEISRLNTCFNKWHKNKSAFSVWQFVE